MSNKSFETLTENEVLQLIPRTFVALENAKEFGGIQDITILESGLEKLLDRLAHLLLTNNGKGN
jgi:hypothetical protein